jgi:hypothetical protein
MKPIPISYSGTMEENHAQLRAGWTRQLEYLISADRWFILPYLETSPECIRADVIVAVREPSFTDESNITCKYCGLDGLHWGEARGERNQKCWTLMDGEEPHDCPKYLKRVADADDFPILPTEELEK